jgi:hypothetical protein
MDVRKLADAIDDFRMTFKISQGFGPDSLPGVLACPEAESLADLLDALGLTQEASELREWHMKSESVEEYQEAHPSWDWPKD